MELPQSLIRKIYLCGDLKCYYWGTFEFLLATSKINTFYFCFNFEFQNKIVLLQTARCVGVVIKNNCQNKSYGTKN